MVCVTSSSTTHIRLTYTEIDALISPTHRIMSQLEPTASKETAQPTVPTLPSLVDSTPRGTPACFSGKESDCARVNSAPASSQGSARGSPNCHSPGDTPPGSLRASRTISWRDSVRVTLRSQSRAPICRRRYPTATSMIQLLRHHLQRSRSASTSATTILSKRMRQRR